MVSHPIYKTTNVCLLYQFFSETAPPILMKLGIYLIHSVKMVLKYYGLILPIDKKLSRRRRLKLRVFHKVYCKIIEIPFGPLGGIKNRDGIFDATLGPIWYLYCTSILMKLCMYIALA